MSTMLLPAAYLREGDVLPLPVTDVTGTVDYMKFHGREVTVGLVHPSLQGDGTEVTTFVTYRRTDWLDVAGPNNAHRRAALAG
jgi:hypothetical protein